MDLITQRNQQASPEGPTKDVCEILSEIKEIEYNKVPSNETVIKLNFGPKKWGEGAKTSIFFVTNEQLRERPFNLKGGLRFFSKKIF